MNSKPPEPALPMSRLDYLFRHSLRSGEINPLLYLLRRYRQGERA